VSSLVPPDEAAAFLRDLRPAADVLTGYPSLLQPLAREVRPGELPLQLVVTNSEQSSRVERDRLEVAFGCPVLDEYSSEELTRIAIELPDKRYYICEDSVFLEVLHPETRAPVADGEWGEAVVTGLLNEAMPFIRYATGDLVRRPASPGLPWCGTALGRAQPIGWGQLEAIGGRILDSFIRPDGSMVPSGAMLDVVYRAFDEIGVCVDRFELIQISPTEARLNRMPSRTAKAATVAAFEARVEELLSFVMGTRVAFAVGDWTRPDSPHRKDKRRPIRRTFRRNPKPRRG
jgi:phenylacetate-CoA ligase